MTKFLFFLFSFYCLIDVSFTLWPYSFVNSSIQLITPFPPGGSIYSLALILNSTFAQLFGIELNLTINSGNGGYDAWAAIPTCK